MGSTVACEKPSIVLEFPIRGPHSMGARRTICDGMSLRGIRYATGHNVLHLDGLGALDAAENAVDGDRWPHKDWTYGTLPTCADR